MTDDCGNSINVTQTITVDDDTDPTASNPAGVTVECIGDVPAVDISVVTDEADNCGTPTVAHVGDGSLIGGACGGTITRTYSVTDDCGNSINVTQTITVDDTEVPTFINCPYPSGITVNADAGVCTASVTFSGATADDNCGMDPTDPITYWIGATQITSPHIFGSSLTTVTVEAKDACGNINNACTFDVTVDAYNDLVVNVDMEASFTGTRCITFELWECPDTEIVELELAFVNGSFSGTVEVPCGDYECITARDSLHTLRTTDGSFTIISSQYVADFTGADELIGGNLNDDFWIDILDFGVYLWQYGACYGTGCPGTPDGDTTCSTGYPHADIDGDGLVSGSVDFTFISGNFLMTHETNCCGMPGIRGGEEGDGPITEISVRELRRLGLGHLTVGDLNEDGWLDEADIVAFMMGARPKPLPDQIGGAAEEVDEAEEAPSFNRIRR